MQQSGQSIGLLVIGEAGSGKSHLIARLRSELAANTRVVLATISLRGSFAGHLWRHVRSSLVAELFRTYPGNDGLNGLLRILRNRFPKWASQSTPEGLLGWFVGRSKTSLKPYLDEFAKTCPLDFALQKVLTKLENPQLNTLAQAWLRGRPLSAEDLTALGLPPVFPSEQEQETIAREVVLSLLRLAGTATTLFLCFDEIEGIQAGNSDVVSLRQFSALATDLLAQTGPRVIATFIRPNLFLELTKAVEPSNLQKMGQDRTNIPPITWEQAVRVTKARLEAEPSCRSDRLDHPDNSYWPLSQEFVQKVFETNKRCLTPRHLIGACAVEFERPVVIIGPPKPPLDDEFVKMWERQRQKYVKKPQEIKFDKTMAIGLPWLVHLMQLPLVWLQEPENCPGDVNLLFQSKRPARKLLGVSYCNHEPRALWRRLDRVLSQWSATMGKTLHSLVVLRSKDERTSEASEARLKALAQAGARVVRVDAQPLAELAAYQAMLTAAQTGDLRRSGKPVAAVEYDAWVQANLSSAVKEFLDLLFVK